MKFSTAHWQLRGCKVAKPIKVTDLEAAANNWSTPGDAAMYGGEEFDDDLLDRLNAADNSAVFRERDELRRRVEQLQSQLDMQAQSGALALSNGGEFIVGGYRLSHVGLVRVSEDVNEDDLQALGTILLRFADSIQWLIGDWLNEAQLFEWGDLEQVARQFRKSVKTLRNWKSVALSVPYDVRHPDLEYNHHMVVQGMTADEQHYWLQSAANGDVIPGTDERKRWSVAKLRDEIAGRTALPRPAKRKQQREYKQRFGRVWQAVSNDLTPDLEDISALKKWLNELEKRAKS